MDYYKSLRLDELGISSDEEAEELEYELDLRFEHFSPWDRKTWLRQNVYLEDFAKTGTIDSAALEAGVTIYTAQTWQYENVLGFTRRLEVATITYQGTIKRKAMLRASEPNAPATLLIELLRAYVPDQFSRSAQKRDTSKPDDAHRRYRENARREKEAGYLSLQRIKQGDPDPFRRRVGTQHSRHTGEGRHPEETPAVSVPSVVSPATRHASAGNPIQDRHPEDAPPPSHGSDEDSHSTTWPDIDEGFDHDDYQPSDVGDPPQRTLTRAERREQLRKQRKAEKRNTFPAKRF